MLNDSNTSQHHYVLPSVSPRVPVQAVSRDTNVLLDPVLLSNFRHWGWGGSIVFSLSASQTCNNLSVFLFLPQENEIMKEIQDNGPVQGKQHLTITMVMGATCLNATVPQRMWHLSPMRDVRPEMMLRWCPRCPDGFVPAHL